MRATRYSRYISEDLDLDSADLLRALADHLLASGFERQFYPFDPSSANTLEELREALREAIESGRAANDPDLSEQLGQMFDQLTPDEQERVLDQLIQKLQDEGYIATSGQPSDGVTEFEVTDKAVDFLGYKALRDLIGSLGKATFGAHDTRDLATGVEAGGAPKPFEFGDTLNLNVSATLFSAIRRQGGTFPLELEYSDLQVNQAEYQSSCATVLMLDCSHSMILYGEDRFTPAKQVALALSHLIRTQYPGDTMRCVLFHDQAEEVKLAELARVQVGPYHTNTRDGLILAQRILHQERKDMKQIIMITDGKPTALTLDDGRVYKNSFGLDPLVVNRTMEEVSRCKRQGILVNTFMLANDPYLVAFVKEVTQTCRGKAYFASPRRLGQYLLLDYMNHKSRVVH